MKKNLNDCIKNRIKSDPLLCLLNETQTTIQGRSTVSSLCIACLTNKQAEALYIIIHTNGWLKCTHIAGYFQSNIYPADCSRAVNSLIRFLNILYLMAFGWWWWSGVYDLSDQITFNMFTLRSTCGGPCLYFWCTSSDIDTFTSKTRLFRVWFEHTPYRS